MDLTEEQYESLKMYGEVSSFKPYAPEKICTLLGIFDPMRIEEFLLHFADENSTIKKTFLQGKYEAEFLTDYAVLQSAQAQKTEGLRQMMKIRENEAIENFKKDLDDE